MTGSKIDAKPYLRYLREKLAPQVAMNRALESLKAILGELADLRHAEAIAEWDSRTFMPAGGSEARANVVATLARISARAVRHRPGRRHPGGRSTASTTRRMRRSSAW